MYFNIFVPIIVDTTSILKLVFPTVYCFFLECYVGGCLVAIIATAVVFIYLFIYLILFLFSLLIYLFIYRSVFLFIIFLPL